MGINPQVPVNRRQNVLRSLRVILRKGALGIGRSDDSATFYRAARQCCAEDIGIVISASIVIHAWCASEFAPGQDERRIEQSAFFQVLDERRIGLIPARQEATPQ